MSDLKDLRCKNNVTPCEIVVNDFKGGKQELHFYFLPILEHEGVQFFINQSKNCIDIDSMTVFNSINDIISDILEFNERVEKEGIIKRLIPEYCYKEYNPCCIGLLTEALLEQWESVSRNETLYELKQSIHDCYVIYDLIVKTCREYRVL